MDIYKELSKVNGNGLLMVDVLKRAAVDGHTQIEAINALQKLFEEASAQGRQKDEDIIVDVMDIAKNFCRPEFRIWNEEQTP